MIQALSNICAPNSTNPINPTNLSNPTNPMNSSNSMNQMNQIISPNVILGKDVVLNDFINLYGCTIGDDVLIGIGAAVLNNALIGDHCIVGAGCVVTPGSKIPAKSLVLGVPGKVVRSLTKSDLRILEDSWQAYVHLSRQYLAETQSSVKELK